MSFVFGTCTKITLLVCFVFGTCKSVIGVCGREQESNKAEMYSDGSLLATYWDRGGFVDHHNVFIHMYNGDRLRGDWYLMSATLQTQYVVWYCAN